MSKKGSRIIPMDEDSSDEDESSPPMIRKPMPASIKRKLAERLKNSHSQKQSSQVNRSTGPAVDDTLASQLIMETSIEDDYTPSSGSQSQQPLSESEFKNHACHVSNYFLIANCKKFPVKRPDVGKLIPKHYNRRVGDVIQAASQKLYDTFGYKIKELSKKGHYILINALEKEKNDHAVSTVTLTSNEVHITGLRTCILTVIFMNGGVMQEATLDEFLKRLDISLENRDNHPIFGNVTKLIHQDFSRQCYLDIIVVKNVDPPHKEFRWGERAHLELDKMKILNHVCEVYGDDVKPEMWTNQHKQTIEENMAVI